jgi:hypothetical protein
MPTNLIGNGVVTIVIAKWEKALDEHKLHQVSQRRDWLDGTGLSLDRCELNLDFETDLDDLGGRNPEIRGREIGVEVHRGE